MLFTTWKVFELQSIASIYIFTVMSRGLEIKDNWRCGRKKVKYEWARHYLVENCCAM